MNELKPDFEMATSLPHDRGCSSLTMQQAGSRELFRQQACSRKLLSSRLAAGSCLAAGWQQEAFQAVGAAGSF